MAEYPRWKYQAPHIPFDLINRPPMLVTEFYKEHVQRDVSSGRLKPSDCWFLMRGFLISAAQSYEAIRILLAEKRPTRLLLQANILCRSLLETLANVLALGEAPKKRSRLLLREAFKTHALRFMNWRQRFHAEDKWKGYLEVYERGLKQWARDIHLRRGTEKNPRSIRDAWPTPGLMIYGKNRIRPFIRGSRRAVIKEVYDFHYGTQSEQAHQRLAAVSMAMLVDKPEYQWNPGLGESEVVAIAMLLLTCVLSEIEVRGKHGPHPKLREVWTYLRDLHDDARDLLALRYTKRLRM
jgi:hypothetical protein